MLHDEVLISMLQDSKRILFILCGLPYAGKSFIANQLIRNTKIEVIAIDDRFSLSHMKLYMMR